MIFKVMPWNPYGQQERHKHERQNGRRIEMLKCTPPGRLTRDCVFCILFRFHSFFLPTLCARDGYVDTPPASREEAKMRRITWGQIWSIQATSENTFVQRKGIDLKPLFKFSYFSNFQSCRAAIDWNLQLANFRNRTNSILTG